MRIAPGHRQHTEPLAVPAQLRAQLDSAVAAGREEAAGWTRIHPTGSTARFDRDALEWMVPPPSEEVAARELDDLRGIAATRTEAGMARSVHFARRAGWDEWEGFVAEIGQRQGPEQAARAARLVREAAARTDQVTGAAKRHFARARPFTLDASLESAITHVGGNPSYPSGHTSGAYAAALVLAAFLPQRAAEIEGLAAEVAWSRMYGGAHFASDVAAGARLAARIVADVLRRDARA